MSSSNPPPVRVGDAIRCFVGRPEQINDPALFYVWRKCHIVEIDDAGYRVRVHYDAASGFADEWLPMDSPRINRTGKRAVSSKTAGSNQPASKTPVLHPRSTTEPQQQQFQKVSGRAKSLSDSDMERAVSCKSSDGILTPPPSYSSAAMQQASADASATVISSKTNGDSNGEANHSKDEMQPLAESNAVSASGSVTDAVFGDASASAALSSDGDSATDRSSTIPSTSTVALSYPSPSSSPPPPLPASAPRQPPNSNTLNKTNSVTSSPASSPRHAQAALAAPLPAPPSYSSLAPAAQSQSAKIPTEDFYRTVNTGSFVDVWDVSHRIWTAAEVLSISAAADLTVTYTVQTLTTGSRLNVKRGSNKLAPPFTKSAEMNPAPPTDTPRSPPPPQSTAGITQGTVSVNADSHLIPTVTPLSPRSSVQSSSFNLAASPPPPAPAVAVPHPPAPAHAPTAPANAAVSTPDQPAGFGASLGVGDKIDCLDTDKLWRVAEVMQATPNEVYVHYDGWQKKWDEWIKRDSKRIQPPRSLTVGYTGPTAANHVPVAKPINTTHTSTNNPTSSRPPAAPAAPVPWTCPPYRPSAQYDCRHECKWRRVLSMGLGHREIQSIDALFTRCCQLQDDYQAMLIAESQPPHAIDIVQQRLREAKMEIENQAKALPAFANFYLQQCRAITNNVALGIGEMAEAMKRQELAIQEEIYIERLMDQFSLVRVPADGNCLFTAVGKGHAKRAEQVTQVSVVSDTSTADSTPSPAASAAPPPAAPFTPPLISAQQLPRVYRERTVELLTSDPSFRSLIETELEMAVSQERDGHGDPTSKSLVRELRDQCGSAEAIDAAIHSDAGVFVYASVMGQDGIYGTAVEVEALSQLLQAPIHVYYRAGSSDDQQPHSGENTVIQPTQIIGEQFPGPPISLAYYMGNRHYNLLLKKPPAPKPAPPPLPASPPKRPSSYFSVGGDAEGDDELMVALLQSNNTPDMAQPTMARSRSSGLLEAMPHAGQQRAQRCATQSKDELTLLKSSPSTSVGNPRAISPPAIQLAAPSSCSATSDVSDSAGVSASVATTAMDTPAEESAVPSEPSTPIPPAATAGTAASEEEPGSNEQSLSASDAVIANASVSLIDQYYSASEASVSAMANADASADATAT